MTDSRTGKIANAFGVLTMASLNNDGRAVSPLAHVMLLAQATSGRLSGTAFYLTQLTIEILETGHSGFRPNRP